MTVYSCILGDIHMNEMISERLIQLTLAQESMKDVVDIMNHLDKSQLAVEKNAFDSINCSDSSLNLAKEGYQLASKLLVSYRSIQETVNFSDDITDLVKELGEVFKKILTAAYTSNDVSHIMEREVAYQRDITDDAKNAISTINASVEQAVACAETLLAYNL